MAQAGASWWTKLEKDIEELAARSASKRDEGGFKRHFHSISKTLDDHKTFLELIPSGETYTSVFCGSLKVILKVAKLIYKQYCAPRTLT